uniref:Si:ch211-117l17.7 n=1 Tax=Cyprinus carpio carpio TaxID=630221 RepID=A0A9J8A101_CYPCA
MNLEELQLDGNQIASISSKLFEAMLDADVFQSLSKLNYLNLADNQLRNLLKTLFHNLRQLKSLVLSSNQLETLESGFFDHLSNLLVLMLQKNQIQRIPERLFWHLPSLLTLSMSGNQLRYIPAESFYYLVLKDLSLSGNKWNCDCSIMGIAEWIHENPKLISDLDKGGTCYEPYHLENHPLQTLTYEELHCGVFQTIYKLYNIEQKQNMHMLTYLQYTTLLILKTYFHKLFCHFSYNHYIYIFYFFKLFIILFQFYFYIILFKLLYI